MSCKRLNGKSQINPDLSGKFIERCKKVKIKFYIILMTVLCSLSLTFAMDTPQELSKIAGWKGLAPNSDSLFSFVILSDRTGGHVPDRWQRAIEQINLLKPDFVISVGDLIEGYTEDANKLNEEWAEFDRMTHQLDAPFFYCPGNHDVSNAKMLEVYIEKYGVDGKSYYSFDYKGSHFIVLDSLSAIRDEEFAAKQLEWLQKDIVSVKRAVNVFVFFHHPDMEDKPFFKKIITLLPKDKTIIFAGHWHGLNYIEHDLVPVYVLAATGASIGNVNTDIGNIPGFAHVAVDNDTENISFIRLDQIFSVEKIQGMSIFKKLYSEVPAYPTDYKNDHYLIKIKNRSVISADYEIIGLLNGQKSTLKGGEEKEITFNLDRINASPKVRVHFKNTKGKVNEVDLPIVFIKSFQAPLDKVVNVDGELNEWDDVSALTANDLNNVILFQENWQGSSDLSFSLKAASDLRRLFVAVNVSDDHINLIPGNPWSNDAVEFYWNTKSKPENDGKHGPGTGQLIIKVPEVGRQSKPFWNVRHGEPPKNCEFAFRRTSKGYNCEMSFLLQELGFNKKPKAGDVIHIEVMIDDLDIVEGSKKLAYMTTSGIGNNHSNTTFYSRVFFEQECVESLKRIEK